MQHTPARREFERCSEPDDFEIIAQRSEINTSRWMEFAWTSVEPCGHDLGDPRRGKSHYGAIHRACGVLKIHHPWLTVISAAAERINPGQTVKTIFPGFEVAAAGLEPTNVFTGSQAMTDESGTPGGTIIEDPELWTVIEQWSSLSEDDRRRIAIIVAESNRCHA